MKQIAVVGSQEFLLGFRLSGIRDTFEVSDDPVTDIENIRSNPDIGIVIIEESILDQVDDLYRIEVEDSVSPVFITLSKTVEQDSLKRLIKKSIGLDVWK
jgi:V/A-type H+/Na+-transporting ATPase subunit F